MQPSSGHRDSTPPRRYTKHMHSEKVITFNHERCKIRKEPITPDERFRMDKQQQQKKKGRGEQVCAVDDMRALNIRRW